MMKRSHIGVFMTRSVIIMITKALVTAGLPTPMSSAVGRYAISVETFLTCLRAELALSA